MSDRELADADLRTVLTAWRRLPIRERGNAPAFHSLASIVLELGNLSPSSVSLPTAETTHHTSTNAFIYSASHALVSDLLAMKRPAGQYKDAITTALRGLQARLIREKAHADLTVLISASNRVNARRERLNIPGQNAQLSEALFAVISAGDLGPLEKFEFIVPARLNARVKNWPDKEEAEIVSTAVNSISFRDDFPTRYSAAMEGLLSPSETAPTGNADQRALAAAAEIDLFLCKTTWDEIENTRRRNKLRGCNPVLQRIIMSIRSLGLLDPQKFTFALDAQPLVPFMNIEETKTVQKTVRRLWVQNMHRRVDPYTNVMVRTLQAELTPLREAEDDAYILLSNWGRNPQADVNAYFHNALFRCIYFGRVNPVTYMPLLRVAVTPQPLTPKQLRVTLHVFEDLVSATRSESSYTKRMTSHYTTVIASLRNARSREPHHSTGRVRFTTPQVRRFIDPTLEGAEPRKVGFIHSSSSEEKLHRDEMTMAQMRPKSAWSDPAMTQRAD